MKIKVKTILHESFSDYKKCSMVISGCTCTFKCGKNICQNIPLFNSETKEIPIQKIVEEYLKNDLTSAIVFAGLEWIDQFLDLLECIEAFREKTSDDIVIYTGYDKEEIPEHLMILKKFTNITMKFGRYIPNQEKHFDPVLRSVPCFK